MYTQFLVAIQYKGRQQFLYMVFCMASTWSLLMHNSISKNVEKQDL